MQSNDDSLAPKAQYKYLTLIAMIYITIMLSGNVLTYKLVDIHGITLLAGSFLTPTWFIMGDIITEVYGYRVYRLIIWQILTCSALFTFLSLLLVSLPPPPDWIYQPHFDYIIKKLPRVLISSSSGIFIGFFFNSYLLSKWKILTRGKYFGVRSICSSAMGEFLFTVTTMMTTMFEYVSSEELLELMLASFILKLIITTVFSFPSVLIARYLKNVEKIDVYDYDTNFNPFLLAN